MVRGAGPHDQTGGGSVEERWKYEGFGSGYWDELSGGWVMLRRFYFVIGKMVLKERGCER